MKKTFIWVGTVIGAAAVMSLAFDVLQTPVAPKTISVVGECLTSAPKDKTAITLRVTAVAPTTAASMRDATAQMADIIAYLKTQTVETQTTQFNSFEKTEWNRELQKSEVLGIETNIAVEVSADNITAIETILTKFAGQKNVYTENLRMYTSAKVLIPIMEECMSVAVENARIRANALAAGDGKTAGRMLSVSYGTDTSYNPTPLYPTVRMAKLAANTGSAFEATDTIVAKDTDVSVSVNAIFEIK